MANRFQVDPADFAGIGTEWGARAHNGRGLLFDDSGFPVIDENLQEKPKVTKQPPRRLPEQPNTSLLGALWDWTKSVLKRFKALFSGGSIQKQKFGQLLSSPFISVGRGYEIPTLKEHRGYFNLDTIAEQEEEARVNFLHYLIRNVTGYSRTKVPDNTEILTYGNYWEQSAILWPEYFGDHASGLKLLVGSKPLCSFFSNCNDMANNAYVGGVRGVFYEGIEIEPVEMTPFERNQKLDDTASYAFPTGLANALRELFNSFNDAPVETLELENASIGGIKEATGAGKYPIFVPRSLVAHDQQDLIKFAKEDIKVLQEKAAGLDGVELLVLQDAIKAKQAELREIEAGLITNNQVNSLPELMAAITELFAEVLGAYPIKIQINTGHPLTQTISRKDGSKVTDKEDPSDYLEIKTLEQPIKINLPNIAETLAEIEGRLLEMTAVQNIQQEYFNRMATELVSLKQLGVNTYDLVDCIYDWTGMPVTHVNDYFVTAFNPFVASDPENTEILQYLIGKKHSYRKPIFAVSKTNQTLANKMFWWDRAASIIQAVHYRRFTGEGPRANVKEFYRHARNLYNQYKGFQGTDEEGNDTNIPWSELKEMFQEGFVDLTRDPSDDLKPWGEDKDQRPKIIEKTSNLGGKTLGDRGGKKWGD